MATDTTPAKETYFGLCPDCHAEPAIRNVNRTHVAHCEKCRVKWIIGANLFSSWRGESEADWEANAAFLVDFREVEPYFTPKDRRETIASRGTACLQTDDEAAAHDRKRRHLIEQTIKTVCGSGGWYVVEVPGKNADIGGDSVDIIHGPLESKEAAEFARKDAVLSIERDGFPCVGSEVPSEEWNVPGRLLRFLHDHEGKSPEDLASALASSTPWVKYDREPVPDDQLPF